MSDQPKITHAFEQMAAFNRDFAVLVGTYFKSLLAQGFIREEALALTVAWQTETMRRGTKP